MQCLSISIFRQQLYRSRRSLHSIALSREIPASFASAISTHSKDKDGPISIPRARKQHSLYLEKLRERIPAICLPALEDYPDSVFVEDSVVAVGKRALITRQGHPTRRGEVDSIQTVLLQLGMEVFDMRKLSKNGLCDGGDCMYTGRHLFVGLSDRTNEEGCEVLRQTFEIIDEEIVIVPQVMQGGGVLHLKSAVSHIDNETILAPEGSVGDKVLEAMQAERRGYQVIRLPDTLACNAVSISNSALLVQDNNCKVSRNRLEQIAATKNMDIEFIDCSELAKKDGALTCCSVLLNL